MLRNILCQTIQCHIGYDIYYTLRIGKTYSNLDRYADKDAYTFIFITSEESRIYFIKSCLRW